jgi:hemoglobin/transferrin/lactoferrin receptor protein
MRFKTQAVALAATLVPMTSMAQAEQIQLDGIVVTTTKTPERAIDSLSASSSIGGVRTRAPQVSPASASSVDAQAAIAAASESQASIGATGTTDRSYIQQTQPNSVSELLKDVPGVETSDNHNDPAQSIGIRGLQDFGRVNVMIDGARQDFQVTGHARNGTFYLEPELIGSVDITRGPTATIYGSGAVGGVVQFETNSADSVLAPGETAGAIEKLGFDTNGNNLVTSTMAAARAGAFDVFGQYVYRRSDDYVDGNGNSVKDTGREDPYAVAAKLRWRPVLGSEFTAGFVGQDFNFKTFTLLTPGELASLPPGFRPTEYNANARNNNYTLKYTYSRPDDDLLNLALTGYVSTTSLDQTEILNSAASRAFDLRTIGFDANNTSRFNTGGIWHSLTYGGDGFHDDVNNSVTDPFDDAALFTPSGERQAFGTFIEDQARITEWLRVIGALRYDTYSLSGNGVSSEGDHLSPKITVGVTPIKGIEVYGTYAEAYRAPAITETLISGVHPGFPFQFLPNPDLEPEVAHNAEVGINVQYNSIFTHGDAFRAKADYFHNNVDDYIDQTVVAPTGPFPFAITYQNVGRAVLDGAELETTYDWGSGFTTLSGTHIRGWNADTDTPLLNIPADRLSSTIGLRFLDNRLTVGERLTFVAAQDRLPPGDNIYQPTPGFTVMDVFASYLYSDDLRFDARIDNIFDKYYINYLDLDPSPGISGKISVTMKLGQ